MCGGKSPTNLRHGSRALAEVLPNGELCELSGQTHNFSLKALMPILIEFFAGDEADTWRELGSRSVPRRLQALGDTYFKAKSQALDCPITTHRMMAEERDFDGLSAERG